MLWEGGLRWGRGEGFGSTDTAHFVRLARTHSWFSQGSLTFTGRNNKNALHHLRAGSKINVFGLWTAHKGILIYSVLWCITAQSDRSKYREKGRGDLGSTIQLPVLYIKWIGKDFTVVVWGEMGIVCFKKTAWCITGQNSNGCSLRPWIQINDVENYLEATVSIFSIECKEEVRPLSLIKHDPAEKKKWKCS